MIMLFKISLTLIMTLGLAACFPVYKTIRPNLNVLVKDQQGHPINQAQVVLTTIQSPGLLLDPHQIQFTQQGQAHFKKASEWQLNVTFLHGVQYYRWFACVTKPGYQTQAYIDINRETKSRHQLDVILVESVEHNTNSTEQACKTVPY
ncbi:hypothetical protein EC844_107132 [Acinetobacter calcoaceticus]|uniref:Carboxypeptidase regulatory-like domain-containing protein n=1 Tax=Acinetobacter calcoaceticus TaxID=471 RepID=A0A4R1XTR3_ACICA|nr:hypothetical protein EC844_107132 [Acinetobacter calcoaceticus]